MLIFTSQKSQEDKSNSKLALDYSQSNQLELSNKENKTCRMFKAHLTVTYDEEEVVY